MKVLNIPYGDDFLLSTGMTQADFEKELKFLLAVKLFELRRISAGKAARLCGMDKIRFLDALGRLGIPVINLDDDQIKNEIYNA